MSAYPKTTEDVTGVRLKQVLEHYAIMWPSISVTCDLVRPEVVSRRDDEYYDEATEQWVRLDENVSAFFFESPERWFDKEEGVIRINQNYVVLASRYGLRVSDEVVISGKPWLVIEASEQAGVAKLKVDSAKARFKPLVPGSATYRQIGMKARIT